MKIAIELWSRNCFWNRSHLSVGKLFQRLDLSSVAFGLLSVILYTVSSLAIS